jgi:predicted DsbA family dithiol-disulfide isomerase
MKITYWSDYACPWCYIGVARLKKAIKEIGREDLVTLNMRAYQLDPLAPKKAAGYALSETAEKYGITLDMAKLKAAPMIERAKDMGLEFNYEIAKNTNTFDAHRLTKFAQSKRDYKKTERLTENLYRAFFAGGLELADKNVLLDAAVAAGFDKNEVQSVLESDEFTKQVEDDIKQAALFNVRGVPFFIAGMYNIPGAIESEDWKKILVEVLEKTGELNKFQGMACGPDGCDG